MRPRLLSALLVLLFTVLCLNSPAAAQPSTMFVSDSTLVVDINTADSVEVLAVVPITDTVLDLWVRTYDFEGKSAMVKDRIHHLVWDRDGDYTRVYHTDTLPGLVVDHAQFSAGGDLILAHNSDQVLLTRLAIDQTLNWEFVVSLTDAGEVTAGVAVAILPSDEFLVLLETDNGAVVQHYSPGGTQLGELELDGIGEAWDMAYAGPQFEDYPVDPWVLVAGSEGSVWVNARDLVVELEIDATSRNLLPTLLSDALRVIGVDSTRTTWFGVPETGSTDIEFTPAIALASSYWLLYVQSYDSGGFFVKQLHYNPRYDTRMDEDLLDATFSSLNMQAMTHGMDEHGAPSWSSLIFAGTTVENPGTDSSDVTLMLLRAEYSAGSDLSFNKVPSLPNTIDVYPSFPNPFNATTTVRLANAVNQHVEINVHDILGRLVLTPLPRTELPPGYHHVTVSADRMSSGMYVVTVTGDRDRARQQKITLIR